ncbi:MAG: hypothetical protein J6W64_10960 [Bacilli bacterium]|nr:hypothetical protein [Bacilli bacterium]
MSKFGNFISKNSPTILSILGATGVIITSGLTIKATIKANNLYNSREDRELLTKKDIVKLYWKEYIPSILSASTTIGCIFGANYINQKTRTTLASAYCLLQNSYIEYKNAANELYENADSKIQAKICEKKYNEKGMVYDDDDNLFYDVLTGQYIECTMDEMLRYEAEFLELLHTRGRVTLNQWSHILGNGSTIIGDELVWYSNDYHDVQAYPDVQIKFIPDTLSNGMKVNMIFFTMEPELDWLVSNSTSR